MRCGVTTHPEVLNLRVNIHGVYVFRGFQHPFQRKGKGKKCFPMMHDTLHIPLPTTRRMQILTILTQNQQFKHLLVGPSCKISWTTVDFYHI